MQLALIPVAIVGLTLIGLLLRSLTNGKAVWSYEGPTGTIAAPLISGNVVLTTFSDGQLECLRLLDGTSVWPSPFRQPQHFANAASIATGIAVVNSDYGRIFAIDMAAGKLLWYTDVDSHLSTAPVVNDDTIYIATSDGHLKALDIKTGKPQFNVSFAEAPFSAQPALFDGVMVLSTSNGAIIGVNPADGTEVWPRRRVDATLLSVVTNVNGLAACGSDEGKLYVVEPDSGTIRFSFPTSGMLRSPAATDGDALYVCDSDGWLYKYRLSDGNKIYSVRIANSVDDGPYVAGEYLLCLVDGNRVLKVDRQSGHTEHAWRGFDNAIRLSTGSDYVVIGTSSGKLYTMKLTQR